MTAIPPPAVTITSLIDAYHESKLERPRPHLGASILGHHCDRWLWLSFRWAVVERFPGRVLRLFRRGHMEEETLISDLRAIGVDIRNSQRRVSFGAHVSGSLDGIAERGVPGAEKTRHVVEFKTHSKKSFDALERDGVEKSKPQHFTQMQVYMHGTEISRALYVAICKDDDRLYTERVKYDKAVAERAIARGRGITLADRMPPPISTDPSWYQCKFCAAHSFCHERQPTQQVNCRTCAHFTVRENDFLCERWGDAVPTDFQHTGCDSHILHPDLVPWPMEGSEDGLSATWLIDGKPVVNGEAGYKSSEIVANPSACASGIRDTVREFFPDAEVYRDAP